MSVCACTCGCVYLFFNYGTYELLAMICGYSETCEAPDCQWDSIVLVVYYQHLQ